MRDARGSGSHAFHHHWDVDKRKTCFWAEAERHKNRPWRGSKEHIAVATGTVKWFNESKGYGFITPDEGGQDFFVHYSNITGEGFRTLQDDMRVEFEPSEGPKGPEAVNVRPA